MYSLIFNLVGFGSGISFVKHYKAILALADRLLKVTSKKAFIFSNSGQANNGPKFHKKLFNQKTSTLLESLTVQDSTLMGLSKFLVAYKRRIPTKII